MRRKGQADSGASMADKVEAGQLPPDSTLDLKTWLGIEGAGHEYMYLGGGNRILTLPNLK